MMLFSTATAISLLGLTSFGVNAAAVHTKRNIDTGSWLLVAKPRGDSTAVAIPIILGWSPDNSATSLSTGDPNEIPLCIELTPSVGWEGEPYQAAAKVHNHPSINEPIWMWKTIGAKLLFTSTRINITGTRGNWTFVEDPNSADMVLALDGDTVASASGLQVVHFGSDTPADPDSVPLTVVGIPVDSCEG